MESINHRFIPLAFFAAILLSHTTMPVAAQSTEVQQLLLNVEKLTQFKNILSDMKKGYQVVSQGYNAVKNISQGNFSIHQGFIDGLMLVSPEVRKYRRIGDILNDQQRIVGEYKGAFSTFKQSGSFSDRDLNYIKTVYSQLLSQSMDNLESLAEIITSSKLRMSDDERLQAIDRIFLDTQEKLTFLRSFNNQALVFSSYKAKEARDHHAVQKFYR